MKRILEDAYRQRQGMIGFLQCCTCTFPLERHETSTGHHAACPTHLMHVAVEDPRVRQQVDRTAAFIDVFIGARAAAAELSGHELLIAESIAAALVRCDVPELLELVECLPRVEVLDLLMHRVRERLVGAA